MFKILVFDIETIPDIDGLRKIYDLDSNAKDEEVFSLALRVRREQSLSDFFPPYLQKIVAISLLYRQEESDLHIGTIGHISDEEPILLSKFFKKINESAPILVSWNGNSFDLPVLQHRGLIHGTSAFGYWNVEGEAKWQNYLNRYQLRHMDLMDILSRYQLSTRAPLSDMAKLCGFPGKLDMDGGDVWKTFQQEKGLQKIRCYCETDVLNTYLLFVRFQLFRGLLTQESYNDEIQLVQSWLRKQDNIHWQQFLEKWQKNYKH